MYRLKGWKDWANLPPTVDLTKALMLSTALLSLLSSRWHWIGVAIAIRYFR